MDTFMEEDAKIQTMILVPGIYGTKYPPIWLH